jgi:hypothetical protein
LGLACGKIEELSAGQQADKALLAEAEEIDGQNGGVFHPEGKGHQQATSFGECGQELSDGVRLIGLDNPPAVGANRSANLGKQ